MHIVQYALYLDKSLKLGHELNGKSEVTYDQRNHIFFSKYSLLYLYHELTPNDNEILNF